MSRMPKLPGLLVLFSLLLVNSGCGVKLAYNNGDRLVRWWVDDYIDMNSEQKRYLRDATRDLLYWHRSQELASYRAVFLRLADDLSQPPVELPSPEPLLTKQELQDLVDQVEQWGRRIGERAVPIAVQMLLSLSAEQRLGFAEQVEEENAEYLEDAQQSQNERVTDMAKDYRKFMSRLVGRLTPAQRDMVLQRHKELVIFEEQTVAFRRQWLQQVNTVLEMETPDRVRLAKLLWLDEEDYPADFQAVFTKNEAVYQQLTLDMINSLNAKQRARFAERLRTLARICQELIEETREAPVPPQPLVVSTSQMKTALAHE